MKFQNFQAIGATRFLIWQVEMTSFDIGRYINRLRDRLDGLVDEFKEYDFTFKPLLSQDEFSEQILPLMDDLIKSENKYLTVHEVFSNLADLIDTDANKLLCLVDFAVSTAKSNPEFAALPGEIVRQLSNRPIFNELKEYIYDHNRIDYPLESKLVPEKKQKEVKETKTQVPTPSKRSTDVTIQQLEKAIKKKKTTTTAPQPAHSRYLKDDGLNFLYEGMSDHGKEPVETKAAKPHQIPEYSLFSDGDPNSLATKLDRFFNMFMKQAAKRLGYDGIDDTLVMHEDEYLYLMSHLNDDSMVDITLPPLIFDDDHVKVKKKKGPSVLRRQIKPCRAKHLSKLKVFHNDRDYLAQFPDIVPRSAAKQRATWLNSFITDRQNLYQCDKLDEILALREANTNLRLDSDDDENPQSRAGRSRGIRLNSTHISKQLSIRDFYKTLAYLVFPNLDINARVSNHRVKELVSKFYSEIYLNFRPYLIEIFLRDLDEFFNMPNYFELDTLTFELQIQEVKERKELQGRVNQKRHE